MNKNAILKSHSIYLRPIEEEDVVNGYWHHWYNDYDVTRYNSHGVYPINIEDERKYFLMSKDKVNQISLAVCSNIDGQVIGTVSLLEIDHLNRKAEIACTIGHNICPTAGLECMGLMIQHGFQRLNLNRIYAGAHEGLKDWVKMLSVLGFVTEGLGRQETLRNGKYHDFIRFSLLQTDYEKILSEREFYLFPSAGFLYKSAIRFLRLKS